MCFVFCTNCFWNIYHSGIILRDAIINVHRSSCKVHVILIRCYGNFSFVCRFSKNTQIPSFMKILPVKAELFHADRRKDWQTWGSLSLFFFCNLANAPKSQNLGGRVLKILVGIYLNNKIHGPFVVRKLIPRVTKLASKDLEKIRTFSEQPVRIELKKNFLRNVG